MSGCRTTTLTPREPRRGCRGVCPGGQLRPWDERQQVAPLAWDSSVCDSSRRAADRPPRRIPQGFAAPRFSEEGFRLTMIELDSGTIHRHYPAIPLTTEDTTPLEDDGGWSPSRWCGPLRHTAFVCRDGRAPCLHSPGRPPDGVHATVLSRCIGTVGQLDQRR